MCETGETDGGSPPNWWNRELYSFLSDLPIQGWVWEFMRRDRLQKLLGEERPVDAMNPEPELEGVIEDSGDWNYYRNWNEYLARVGKPPVHIPPAVSKESGWPRGFHGQQYTIRNWQLYHNVHVRVDLDRRDSVIKRDFEHILREFREEYREPKRVSPRIQDWIGNYILEVWDLRQFDVTWFQAGQLLGLGSGDPAAAVQSARNAYNTAEAYIDGDKWSKLARYVDVED